MRELLSTFIKYVFISSIAVVVLDYVIVKDVENKVEVLGLENAKQETQLFTASDRSPSSTSEATKKSLNKSESIASRSEQKNHTSNSSDEDKSTKKGTSKKTPSSDDFVRQIMNSEQSQNFTASKREPSSLLSSAPIGTIFGNSHSPLTSEKKDISSASLGNIKASGSLPAPTPLKPYLRGLVSPLKNFDLVKNSSFSLIENAYASTCAAVASLYSIDSNGVVGLLPLKSISVKSDTSFNFDLSSMNINFSSPELYLLDVTGCNNNNYSRIVTDFYTDQNINNDTTLIAKVLEVTTNKNVPNANTVALVQLTNIGAKLDSPTLNDSYTALSEDTTAKDHFQSAFGSPIVVLTNTKPLIASESIPFTAFENSVSLFTVEPQHWYAGYDIVTEWYLDGNFVTANSNFNYFPGKNDQGNHTVTVKIGRNNTSGRIDFSEPVEIKSWSVTTVDLFPPVAPTFNLNLATPSPVINDHLLLDINTGNNLENCETFSDFAITEDNIVPTSALFSNSCSTPISQTMAYTLLNGVDGPQSLYLWTRDSVGTVSAPGVLNYRRDVAAPIASLDNIIGVLRGGSTLALSFLGSDANEVSKLELFFSSNNGTTFTKFATLAPGTTTYNWNVDAIDTINGIIKLVVTDGANTTTEAQTGTFGIDSTAPVAPALTILTHNPTNSTDLNFSVNTCADYSAIFINTGAPPTRGDPGWVPCSEAVGHYHISLTAVDSTQSFAVWGKDAVGNISASTTINHTFDATLPVANISDLPLDNRGGDIIALNFNSSDASGILSTVLEYTTDGTTYLPIATNPISPYSWTMPTANSSITKLKFTVTDNAGNISTVYTSNFELDSTPPAAPLITLSSAAITNSTAVTFTASTCADRPFLLVNEGVQPLLSDPAWQACATTANAITYSMPPTEALHTLKIWARDSVGNISVSSTDFAVTYDITLPAVTVTNLAALLKGGTSANITFSKSDLNGIASHKLQYSLDGVTYTDIIANPVSPYAWTIPSANTSNATIRIIAIDSAGNSNQATTVAFIIDSTAPAVSITGPAANIRGGNTVNISFTTTDLNGIGSNKLQYAADGVTFVDVVTNPVSPYSWSVPVSDTAGSLFKLVSTDNAGNVTSTNSTAFSIDSTPPAAPLLALSSAAITNSTAITFTASTCADRPFLLVNEGAQPALGDLTWQACSATANAITYSIAATEALHTLKVWAKDSVGNVSVSSTNFSVTYDITLPAVSVTNLAAIVKGGSSANITFTKSDLNGIASHKLQYSSDGVTYSDIIANPVSPYAWAIPTANTSSARVRIIAIDSAGNSNQATTVAFTIDSTGPVAPVANLNSAAISGVALTTYTISDCVDRSAIFVSESPVALLDTDLAWQACTTAVGGINETLVGPILQGNHNIYVFAKDSVGNISLANPLSMTYDTTPPSVSLSTVLASLYKGGDTVNLNFSASDSSGINSFKLEYSSDGSTYSLVSNLTAVQTSYTWTVPNDNTNTAVIRLTANDNSAPVNSASASSVTFTIDSTPPAAPAVTLASNYYSNSTLTSLTVASCTDRPKVLVNEGTQPASTDPSWANCVTSAGGISYSIATTQGIHNLHVWAKDSAGNVSLTSGNVTMIFDSIAPSIIIANDSVAGNQIVPITFTLTEANTSAAQTFLIEYHDGTSWNSWTMAATNGPHAGTIFQTNITTPNSESTLLTFKVTYVDLAGNSTTATTQFRSDIFPPILDSLSINSGALTAVNNNVQVALGAHDSTSKVRYFCLKYNNSSQPTATDSCWIDVSAPIPGIAPAASISFSGYYYQIGFTKSSYAIYAWVKDTAGQISINTNSINVDKYIIDFDPGTPPSISAVQVANSNTPATPIVASDLVALSGADIYIKWNASDLEGLAVNPINIQYTNDDINFSAIAGGANLVNGANGSCTVDPGFTGCAKLSSPLNTYFKIRVIAKDTLGSTVFLNASPFNEGKLRILGGNTEHGLNGSALSAVFYSYGGITSFYGFKNKLAVSEDGKFFYIDPLRGLLWIDPSTGILNKFMNTTGVRTGDGGNVSAATLVLPSAITIDAHNNLLIWDYYYIRKVNLDTMIITTIVGGGGNPDPLTTVSASTIQLNGFDGNWGTFIPLPNGDIIFTAPEGSLHHRRFRAIDNQVELMDLQGSGFTSYPGETWSDKGKLDLGLIYDTTTSQINFMAKGLYKSWVGDSYSLYTRIDQTAGNATTPYPGIAPYDLPMTGSNLFTGLDGKLYIIDRFRTTLNRYDNVSNTNTRIIGTGGQGAAPCPEHTPATSCAINIDTVFISKNSRIYFMDNGVMRTIDDSNNIISLFGQYPSFGNGSLATTARFGNIMDISMGKSTPVNNKIIVEDTYSTEFREFTIGSTVAKVTDDYYSWHGPWSFDVDPVTGDIMSPVGAALQRFNRTTSTWSTIVGGGASAYFDPSSDGQIGANINLVSGYHVQTNGFINNKLYYAKHYWTGTYQTGCTLKSYDAADSYRQAHFMGTGVCSSGIINGGSLANNPVGETDISKLDYFQDPNDSINKFFLVQQGTSSIYSATTGGTINLFANVGQNINSFTHKFNTDGLNLYFCSTNGNLYKYIYNSSQTVLLSWLSPTIKCKATRTIIYNSERNSLIFPYSQNGLDGVAEYDLNP